MPSEPTGQTTTDTTAAFQARLGTSLRRYAAECARDGSPLYALLLSHAADDVAAGGACWQVLESPTPADLRDVPALRLMGAVHRLVLMGQAPALARYYPSAGGMAPRDAAEQEAACQAFHAVIAGNPEKVRALARQPVQTNEVGRSAALVGGFLTVARETGLPLRLVEVGSSAGLNLRWDHYRYEADELAWGDPNASLRFSGAYREGTPPLAVSARVVERAGCDRAPLDPCSERDRLTLLSFVWADQLHRVAQLRAALDVACAHPAEIAAASAPDWLADQLAAPRPGLATVIFHSIVLGYLSDEDRARVPFLIAEAGERATRDAPLAWLRCEPDKRRAPEASIRLTLWPRGDERLLAKAGFHGQYVRWLAH